MEHEDPGAVSGFWRNFRAGDIGLLIASLVLAVTALVQADIFGSEIATEVRVSNVYVAPGVKVDEKKAEQIIGNRQLVVIYLKGDLGNRGADVCDQVSTAAAGSAVAIFGEDLDMYGCALYPDADGKDFGRAFVTEANLDLGVATLVDQPTDAAKVLAYNFDRLVASGNAPQEARTITTPISRYLIAGVSISTVVALVIALYMRGRRLGNAHAHAIEVANRQRGRLAERDMLLASAGRRLVELDAEYALAGGTSDEPTSAQRGFVKRFERVMTKYRKLNDAVAEKDPSEGELREQTMRAQKMRDEAFKLYVPDA